MKYHLIYSDVSVRFNRIKIEKKKLSKEFFDVLRQWVFQVQQQRSLCLCTRSSSSRVSELQPHPFTLSEFLCHIHESLRWQSQRQRVSLHPKKKCLQLPSFHHQCREFCCEGPQKHQRYSNNDDGEHFVKHNRAPAQTLIAYNKEERKKYNFIEFSARECSSFLLACISLSSSKSARVRKKMIEIELGIFLLQWRKLMCALAVEGNWLKCVDFETLNFTTQLERWCS